MTEMQHGNVVITGGADVETFSHEVDIVSNETSYQKLIEPLGRSESDLWATGCLNDGAGNEGRSGRVSKRNRSTLAVY
jgi:hypothetical protein